MSKSSSMFGCFVIGCDLSGMAVEPFNHELHWFPVTFWTRNAKVLTSLSEMINEHHTNLCLKDSLCPVIIVMGI